MAATLALTTPPRRARRSAAEQLAEQAPLVGAGGGAASACGCGDEGIGELRGGLVAVFRLAGEGLEQYALDLAGVREVWADAPQRRGVGAQPRDHNLLLRAPLKGK